MDRKRLSHSMGALVSVHHYLKYPSCSSATSLHNATSFPSSASTAGPPRRSRRSSSACLIAANRIHVRSSELCYTIGVCTRCFSPATARALRGRGAFTAHRGRPRAGRCGQGGHTRPAHSPPGALPGAGTPSGLSSAAYARVCCGSLALWLCGSVALRLSGSPARRLAGSPGGGTAGGVAGDA